MFTDIDHIVGARLLVAGDEQQSVSLMATLRYRAADPLAAQIVFPADVSLDGSEVVWTFARALLAAGLRGRAGHGDVQVWPCGPDRIMVELRTWEGRALIELATAHLRCFLSSAYEVVPAGHEQRHLDLDALVAALLEDAWGETLGEACGET